jgi:class 3 adenylate cyclase
MNESDASMLSILFADIVGSTRLYERFGNERAHAAVDACLGELKQITRQLGGRTVKTIGDELMAVFPDAEAACLAATDMQWKVSELPPIDDVRISIRIGFHYGPAMERDGDVFGDSVNVASRIAELAKGEQIITSAPAFNAISSLFTAGARHLWQIPVKGRAEPVDVFEILWNPCGDTTATISGHFAPPKNPDRLRLVYRGKEVCVTPECPVLSIGRDGVNELGVDDNKASRVHARIELRRDKFVLVDVSTNGTFVMGESNVETCLRREEHILDGKGTLSLGHSHTAGPRDCVEFCSEFLVPGSGSTSQMPEKLSA